MGQERTLEQAEESDGVGPSPPEQPAPWVSEGVLLGSSRLRAPDASLCAQSPASCL